MRFPLSLGWSTKPHLLPLREEERGRGALCPAAGTDRAA